MSALSEPTRLRVWRELVERLPDGMAASDIAQEVGMSRNAMSPHLAILSDAGLLTAERRGRSIVYRATMEAVVDLAAFLDEACRRN